MWARKLIIRQAYYSRKNPAYGRVVVLPYQPVKNLYIFLYFIFTLKFLSGYSSFIQPKLKKFADQQQDSKEIASEEWF